jgi:hypothetical protein
VDIQWNNLNDPLATGNLEMKRKLKNEQMEKIENMVPSNGTAWPTHNNCETKFESS